MFFTVISSGWLSISTGEFIYPQARFLTLVERVADKRSV